MYKYCIMESFYRIVITVALIALIGSLTYVGMLMKYHKNKNTTYPPVASSCPDFWTVSSTDQTKCDIPKPDASGIQNVGSIYSGTALQLNSTNTPGLDTQANNIKFSDATWGVGSAATCKKQKWANQYGLVWDGISNYNSC